MKKLFLNDQFILMLIIINTVVTFCTGFDLSSRTTLILESLDVMLSFLFIIEILTKLKIYGRKYVSDTWNIFDMLLVSLSIPTILVFLFDLNITDLSFLLVFRILRLIRTIRVFKFIPRINHLFDGIIRGMKSSIVIIFVLIIYIIIVSVLSQFLFKDISPEYFKNPLTSLYTIFKMFTLEGWYSVPESIVANINSSILAVFVYIYFIFIVMTGGVFGLSIVNSIFVDAMVSDNNDELEKKVDELNRKIDLLLSK